MKNIGLLISSLTVFFVILINLYYNFIALDVKTIEDDIKQCNNIFETILNDKFIDENKNKYTQELFQIKENINNDKTSFFIKDYKDYKIDIIDSMINYIENEDKRDKYLDEINHLEKTAQQELNKIIR